MQIRVQYDGKDYELPASGPADLVAFERQFKVSSTALGDEGSVRFEWICFLVYRGLRKLKALLPEDEVGGLTPVGLSDGFLERIGELEMDAGDDEEESAGGEHAVDPSVQAAPLG